MAKEVIAEDWNAFEPIEFSTDPPAMDTVVSKEHAKKEPPPIEVTVAGIATDLSVAHLLKASCTILMVPAGIATAPLTSGVIKQHPTMTV